MKDITNKVKLQYLAWNDPRGKDSNHIPVIWSYNGHETILNSGETDDIYFITHNGHLLLMSINGRYCYAGIEVYDPETMEMVTEYFDQNVNDENSPLYGRRDFFSYVWYTQARKLYDIAQELM